MHVYSHISGYQAQQPGMEKHHNKTFLSTAKRAFFSPQR